jgi:hypothetical protein
MVQVGGEQLLQLDSTILKQLGVTSKGDRDRLKDRIKELRKTNDKERKKLDKEKREKEKMGRSAGKTSFTNFR